MGEVAIVDEPHSVPPAPRENLLTLKCRRRIELTPEQRESLMFGYYTGWQSANFWEKVGTDRRRLQRPSNLHGWGELVGWDNAWNFQSERKNADQVIEVLVVSYGISVEELEQSGSVVTNFDAINDLYQRRRRVKCPPPTGSDT